MVPSGWKKAALGEYIVEHRKKSTTQGEYDVFTSSRKGLVLQSEYFSGSRLAARENVGYNILPNNHITYRSRSDDGIFVFNINKTGNTGIISHFYPVFKIKNGDIGFFLELLNYHRRKIGAFSVGTSQTVLSMNALRKVNLNIPPPPEQKKIARILSTWDKAIETVNKLIENSQQQKKALMQQLLTGKKRLPGFSGKWEKELLKDVLEYLKDGTHFSPQSKKGPCMYITSKNIKFGKIDITDASYISKEEHENIYKSCPVKHGDILLTKDGANTGNAAINCLHDKFSLLSSVAFMSCHKETSLNTYLLQLFLSPHGQCKIKSEMSGQAITRLTLTQIGKMSFLFPPIQEQRAIVNILSTYDKNIDCLTLLRDQYQMQKKALMQQLLTGKRRVQVSE